MSEGGREAEVPITSSTSDRSRESSDLDEVGASHYIGCVSAEG